MVEIFILDLGIRASINNDGIITSDIDVNTIKSVIDFDEKFDFISME